MAKQHKISDEALLEAISMGVLILSGALAAMALAVI